MFSSRIRPHQLLEAVRALLGRQLLECALSFECQVVGINKFCTGQSAPQFLVDGARRCPRFDVGVPLCSGHLDSRLRIALVDLVRRIGRYEVM